jgi:uncharacterized protein
MSRKTALITGASAGLGEQFAHLFARDGHDVVLVARNEARLNALSERLRHHQVTTHVVASDLSAPDAPQTLFAAVKAKGLHIDFLVNNAGFGSTGPFLDLPLATETEMLQVNCSSLMALCHLFGREMRTRGHGKILNIASTAGFQAGPFMATYYASKAFVVHFTEALAHELKGSGVTATCHCPGATHTEFATRAGNGNTALFKQPGVAKPEAVAFDAYEAMMEGDVLAIHGIMNWVAVQSTRLVPRAAIRSIAAALNRTS